VKLVLKGLVFCAVLLGCFGFGFTWRDLRQAHLPDSNALARLFNTFNTEPNQSPEQIFRDSYNKILADYERPVVATKLKYAGMVGLMDAVGDPHTMFLVPQDAEEFSSETKANIVGIGAKLQPDPLGAKAARVFDSGPAYAAGMRDGDVITTVDGKAIAGQSLDDIVLKIKGKAGSVVHLQIVCGANAAQMSFTIKRQEVIVPTVDSKYLSASGVGYMSVASFSEPTAEQFDAELAKLEKHSLKGLVIDLRGNPGGLLESAREMLSRFVDSKLVVKMKDRDGNETVARTYPGLVHDFSYPIVLLVNEDSASAAEIFSGALRDYKMATLIGEHTYGKASVQNVFPLTDGSSAKITIARYYLPSGQDIGRKLDAYGEYESGGLDPDIKVPIDEFDQSVEISDPVKDPQLAKAIDYILSKQRS
jgi:carboxyl-terminal processing protease